MEYGVHLPLMDFEGDGIRLDGLLDYATEAERLGYVAITANDHLVFATPWLDGLTALAAVTPKTQRMQLATSVTLLAVRVPVAVAKALGAIDLLSGGRLLCAAGPGSSQKDYECAGVPFDERWKRLDEGVQALRALWSGDDTFSGRFYSTEGVRLAPEPVQKPPPIWIGSWGSDAGLRRVARLADGWLASTYNTTPAEFAEGLRKLAGFLEANGKDPASFPNALATMWFYITDDRAEEDRIVREVLGRAVNRPEDVLRSRLIVGPAEKGAELLSQFAAAGLQRVYVWPIRDNISQIGTFMSKVAPLVEGSRG